MTLQEAADKLAADLHDTSAGMVETCKEALQDARYLILNKLNDWSFLESQGTLVTVADQANYDLGTDFAGSTTLRKITQLSRDTNNEPILLKTMEFVQNLPAQTGTPKYAYTWQGTLYLYPTPGEIETINWKGYNRVADLADDDEPEWERTYDVVWRLGALPAGLHYLDDEREAQAWAVFNYHLTNMFGDDTLEDEDITLENFSGRRQGIYRDAQGAIWP